MAAASVLALAPTPSAQAAPTTVAATAASHVDAGSVGALAPSVATALANPSATPTPSGPPSPPGDATPDVSLTIDSTVVVADGAPLGPAGAYEKLRGTFRVALNPSDRRNAVITDLDLAPKNAQGQVEYTAEFFLLRPTDLARWGGTLFYDVNNRGNLLANNIFNAGSGGNDPTTLANFGNRFLFEQGFAYLSVGWQGDLLPSPNVLDVVFPVAQQRDGSPLTQRIAVEYSDDLSFNPDGSTTTLPLSGSAAMRSYPAVLSEMASAQLYVRPSDSPRPGGVGVPQGELVPRSEWSFTSPTQISLPSGFDPGMVYELNYVAQDPTVQGLAYATTRDAVSFLRFAGSDADGTPNPLPGIRQAVMWGASQSGAYARDYVYQGFNEDLAGRQVFEGVGVHIAGALKGQGEMYRFGQLNPWADQHRGRLQPGIGFPFNYGVRRNPLVASGLQNGPLRDGILKRPNTDPVVMQTDSSNEYWWAAAGLVDTDGFGRDVALPANARHYLISGTQHGAAAVPTLGVCQQLNNPVSQGPALRALMVGLRQWVVDGTPPPPSQRPTYREGTLAVPGPNRGSIGFPRIPGVEWTGLHHVAGERDYGAQVSHNAGIIDDWTQARWIAQYVTPVPRTNRIGIDRGGVEVPDIGVPLATATGWNLRRAPYTAGDLCGLNGMYIPLHVTQAQQRLTGDQRPSLQELYGDHAGYVAAMERFVARQTGLRLLLPADAAAAVAAAQARPVP